MVKPKPRKRLKEPVKHSPAEVEKSAKEILALLRKGARVAKWLEKNGGHDTNAAERAATRFKLRDEDDARKLARLATPETGFTEIQIEELTELAIEHGFLLRPTPLKRLLAVRDRKKRMAMARRMIRKGWSQSRTEAEVREHNSGPGHQTAAGRPPRVPETPAQLLDEFVRLSVRWVRLAEAAKKKYVWTKIRRGSTAIDDVTERLKQLQAELRSDPEG